MEIWLLKSLLLVAMIIAVLVAGLLPVRVLKGLRHSAAHASTSQRHRHISLVLCLLTCFSGGVFLATCFLHLFPELVVNVQDLDTNYGWHVDYPIAELLSCLGFFLLFFLEEVVIMAIPSMAHGHSHGHHEEVIPATKDGGCCMTTVPATIAAITETKVASNDGTTEPMLNSVEGTSGHCQKHCPLTVHRRHSAGASDKECNEGSVEDVTSELCALVTSKRRVYGSTGYSRSSAEGPFTTVILAEPERCETNCDEVDEDPPILMKSSPHAHSHGVRSITFVIALSFHELIEGVAFGVQSDVAKITALFLSLLVHKIIVAFSVGLQLARTHAHQLHLVITSVVIVSLTSPLGALFGILLTSSDSHSFAQDMTITILQGLAVGTFLYVTFFEVLLHERDNEHPNLLKLLVMLVGFSLIGLLRLIDSHDHSHQGSNETVSLNSLHGHGHSHSH